MICLIERRWEFYGRVSYIFYSMFIVILNKHSLIQKSSLCVQCIYWLSVLLLLLCLKSKSIDQILRGIIKNNLKHVPVCRFRNVFFLLCLLFGSFKSFLFGALGHRLHIQMFYSINTMGLQQILQDLFVILSCRSTMLIAIQTNLAITPHTGTEWSEWDHHSKNRYRKSKP